jgi:hypothetical protein
MLCVNADAINNPPIPEPISPERDEEEEGEEELTPQQPIPTSEPVLDHTDTPPPTGALEYERKVASSSGKMIIYKVVVDAATGEESSTIIGEEDMPAGPSGFSSFQRSEEPEPEAPAGYEEKGKGKRLALSKRVLAGPSTPRPRQPLSNEDIIRIAAALRVPVREMSDVVAEHQALEPAGPEESDF